MTVTRWASYMPSEHIVTRVGEKLKLHVTSGDRPILGMWISSDLDTPSSVLAISIAVDSRSETRPTITRHPMPWVPDADWAGVDALIEEIAAYVQGDGADSMRLALADGIRRQHQSIHGIPMEPP